MTINDYRETWDMYTASWKAESGTEKLALFRQCLDSSCLYNDPLIKTHGWGELEAYMIDFHKQIQGGHFVTTYFLAHSGKSIARWEMRNGNNILLGDGISYGEYNEKGKLISMTGFFEVPKG